MPGGAACGSLTLSRSLSRLRDKVYGINLDTLCRKLNCCTSIGIG